MGAKINLGDLEFIPVTQGYASLPGPSSSLKQQEQITRKSNITKNKLQPNNSIAFGDSLAGMPSALQFTGHLDAILKATDDSLAYLSAWMEMCDMGSQLLQNIYVYLPILISGHLCVPPNPNGVLPHRWNHGREKGIIGESHSTDNWSFGDRNS